MALGLGNGAKKYGPFNWRVEPVQGRVYLEAAMRHLLLLLDGEDFDRDTGIHHGAFVLSTVAIYLDAMVQGTLIDNRALVGRTGDLVALFNKIPGQERTPLELEQGLRNLIPDHFAPVFRQHKPVSECTHLHGYFPQTPTTKRASRRRASPVRKAS